MTEKTPWIQVGIAFLYLTWSICRLKNRKNWGTTEDYNANLRFYYYPWITDIFLMFVHMVIQYCLADNLPVFELKELILSLALFLGSPVWAMVTFLNQDADKIFLRRYLKK